MKRVLKVVKVLALALTFMTGSITVHADNVTEYDVTTTQGTESCVVTATGQTTFQIRMPQTMQLSVDANGYATGTYEIGVKGTVGSGDIINVTPVTNFTMSCGNQSSTATVTQDITKWGSSASTGILQISNQDYVTTSGNVSVRIGAGTYTGTMRFTISIQ